MRAASISSRGMPRKNWRNRKMANGVPQNAGTIRGLSESIQPSSRKRMNTGMSVTTPGSIIVASTP